MYLQVFFPDDCLSIVMEKTNFYVLHDIPVFKTTCL